MTGKKVTDVFSSAQDAAAKAFDRARMSVGGTVDSDLQIYEQLKPDNFTDMIRKYGLNGVLRYIKEMEFRKMRR